MSDNFHYTMDKSMVDKLKPCNRQVIIQLKDDRQSHNGIFLPTSSPLVPDRGVLVKVSDDLKEKEVLVVGAKVIFEKYSGKKIFTDNETFLMLHEDYILAVLPDDADIGIKYNCSL